MSDDESKDNTRALSFEAADRILKENREIVLVDGSWKGENFEKNDILRAQIEAGENAVVAKLRRMGLVADEGRLSNQQILDWSERHNVPRTLKDLRCMVEDAATLTPNAVE